MSRSKKKHIFNEIDKRELGYYSTPKFVADFLTDEMTLLGLGEKVLDPCTGKEELLNSFLKKSYNVHSLDVMPLKQEYSSVFQLCDFFKYYEDNLNADYDYYISNPPYNCHESNYMKENKEKLDSLFGNMGGNLYAYFVSGIINMAKKGAVIGLIIPDSFLTLKGFTFFREKIIKECSIHHLIMCPKNLFKEQEVAVTTCLLILQKGTEFQKEINVANRSLDIPNFKECLKKRDFKKRKYEDFLFNFSNETRFLIDVDEEIKKIFNYQLLGDICKCVSGVKTGNDKIYLSKEKTETHSIPFYKNPGKHKFICKPNAYLFTDFLNESKKVKTFSVTNKSYYFKQGITCSFTGVLFSACLMPEGSMFSVNPNVFISTDDLYWLLCYLNSDLVLYVLRNVILKSNITTPGYVAKIPIIPFSNEQKKQLENICLDILNDKNGNLKVKIQEMNEIIYDSINLTQQKRDEISFFKKNINKLV